MGGKVTVPPESIEKMARLKAQGISFSIIAQRFGISRSYAMRLVKDYERKVTDGKPEQGQGHRMGDERGALPAGRAR